jgi:hypothetical protein
MLRMLLEQKRLHLLLLTKVDRIGSEFVGCAIALQCLLGAIEVVQAITLPGVAESLLGIEFYCFFEDFQCSFVAAQAVESSS